MQNRSMKDAYMLRLPVGWREAIKEQAGRNRRSMNQEILAALESVVGAAATGEGLGNSAPAAALNPAAGETAASFNLSAKDTENDDQ